MRRSLFPVLLAVAGLGFALLPLAQGRMFFYFDNARQHYASTAFLHQALRSGVFPQWFPASGLGFPIVAEGQAAHHYPVRVAAAYLFSPSAALMWEVGLYLAIAGLATYFFLRELRVNRWGCLLGGVTQMFSAASLIYVRNMALHRSLCLVPLAMLFTERLVRTGTAGSAAGLSLTLALQLLSGHPTMAIVTLVGASVYWLSRHIQQIVAEGLPVAKAVRRLMVAAGWWIGSLAVGFGLAAIQVIPTAQLAAQSTRQGGLSYWYAAGNLASRLGDLPQAVFPYAYRQGDWLNAGTPAVELNFFPFSNSYIGILPLLLAWCAIALVSRWMQPALSLAITFLVTVILALGSKTPLFLILWKLPGMSGMRYPSRFLLLSSFCLACLGAIGLHGSMAVARWPKGRESWHRVLWMAAGGVTVAALAVAVRMPAARAGIGVSSALWLMAIMVAAAVVHAKSARRFMLAVTVVVAAADLLVYRSMSGYAATYPLSDATSVSDSAALLKRDGSRFRTLSLLPLENGRIGNRDLRDLVQANLSSVWGIDSMDTRGSLLPLRYFLLREGLVWELTHVPQSASRLRGILGAFNVKYVLGDASEDLQEWDEVFSSSTVRVWKNPVVLPRAYLVGRVEPEALQALPERDDLAAQRLSSYRETIVDWNSRRADAQIVDNVLARDLDYRTTAVVDATTWPSLSGAEPKFEIEDLSRTNEPDSVHLKVRTDVAALLVVGNSFVPGWTATVNGSPSPIVRTNWLLQGLFVSPGESEVRLSYQAPGWRTGAIISAATTMLLIGAFVIGRAGNPRTFVEK